VRVIKTKHTMCDLSDCGLISDCDVYSNSSDSSETSGCDVCWHPRSKCEYLFDCICGKSKCSNCRCIGCDSDMIIQLRSFNYDDISNFQEITDWANKVLQYKDFECTLEMTIFVCIEKFAILDYVTGKYSNIELPWKHFHDTGSFHEIGDSSRFLKFIENIQGDDVVEWISLTICEFSEWFTVCKGPISHYPAKRDLDTSNQETAITT
jgi:hypothetical protein